MVSPYFQIGQNIGRNQAKFQTQAKDESAIESILSQAMQTEDPSVLQNSIGKILSSVSPERQGAAVQYLQNTMQNLQKKQDEGKRRASLEKEGINPDLPESLQKVEYENRLQDAQANRILGNQSQAPAAPIEQGGLPAQNLQDIANIPNQQEPAPKEKSGFQYKDLTDEQLVQLRGLSAFKLQADSELKRRQEQEKASKSQFEPEADKLEAKRVSELADEVEKEYHSAKEENMRLDRMEKIDNKGNVSTPALVKILDAVGVPLGVLANPDTEEYRKLETDFVRNVSKVFPGGKITNYEIQSYLKTIPGLMNSPEGRAAIVRNRKLLNDAKLVRYEAYKKIIKDNNGRKPQNLGILIEEATAEKMDKIEEEFVSGVKEQIEKFQTPIRMIDPSGQPVDIPPNQIEAAMKAGAKFK